IVETEAYLGPEDAASHAAFRPGSRALFYGEGGFAYIYLNYGIHCCLNAIAGRAGRPGCVLIRALEPTLGLATMARRRGGARAWGSSAGFARAIPPGGGLGGGRRGPLRLASRGSGAAGRRARGA